MLALKKQVPSRIVVLALSITLPLLAVGCSDTVAKPGGEPPGTSPQPWLPVSGVGAGDDQLQPSPEETLAQKGVELSVPSLLGRVEDERESLEVRFLSALVLAKTGDESAVAALIDLLQDQEADLRYAAVVGLGGLGSAEAIPSLKASMADPSERVRLAAVGALANLGGDEAARALSEKVTDTDEPSDDVRANAAFSLGDMRVSVAKPWLIDALDDRGLEVRTAAAVALADLGDSRAIPVLIETLKNPGARDWLVVKAIEGLRGLTGLDFGYPKPYWAPATEDERAEALRRWIDWWENQ